MESWDWVPASVIYGMGVGGLMFACLVRCESIYEDNAGTPSSLAAIRGADCLPKVQNADADWGPLEQTELGQYPAGRER